MNEQAHAWGRAGAHAIGQRSQCAAAHKTAPESPRAPVLGFGTFSANCGRSVRWIGACSGSLHSPGPHEDHAVHKGATNVHDTTRTLCWYGGLVVWGLGWVSHLELHQIAGPQRTQLHPGRHARRRRLQCRRQRCELRAVGMAEPCCYSRPLCGRPAATPTHRTAAARARRPALTRQPSAAAALSRFSCPALLLPASSPSTVQVEATPR